MYLLFKGFIGVLEAVGFYKEGGGQIWIFTLHQRRFL